ncbi:hypothetical protein LOD99_2784 [Oopsacas minuta]|uniref:Uncharacterized protein n=1 Tax=Oopsacas minuta TaxID=111878 RepID=A0AAV7K2A5_9METZ|nr:hypothetical protein LOD99_2784 [Oopsacas minuta]
MAANLKKDLEEIMEREENKYCADCGFVDPDWCNIRVGVLICKTCAGIHRGLATNRVKSLKLDSWTADEVDLAIGNRLNEQLEKFLPMYYSKPIPSSQTALKESFIICKYDGKLFEDDNKLKQSSIGTGEKSGFLHKKGKSKEAWKPRFFVVKNSNLEYFIKIDDTNPKVQVPIKDIGINLEEINLNMFAMAITYFQESSSSRNYYAYSDNNLLTIEWYYTILCAQNKIANSMECINLDGSMLCSGVYLQKSGYLYKPGPAAKDVWRKRWFFYNKGYLSYYKEKLDAHPKGEIKLGKRAEGFEVCAGESDHHKQAPYEHTFQLKTPPRTYKLCAETRDDMVSWVKLLNQTIQDV